ncbi:WD repeat and HMG-box DNA-binding protein 1 [Plodia interpunctella]|uniref:WD repeat and HMG-box DNA-binding protein 1 n=1 Tax=Plodia interpunctella TaxID=58824 RepID=UPI0023688B3B|nr:WD repeat and HMG-box DNA-binding protein 1 [Plodia interpunctella]
MKIESKPLRYAHAEGHTDICYSEDGKHIITCGHDGDVRIWLDIEDDDPTSHCVGESALAVCYKDKRLYVATDNHAVQAYTFPAFDKDGIITRFTAPVTQIKSTSKIEALGCSSENMEAKICSLEGGAPLFVMGEHKGPVLSIAICPHMKYASTACGDGMMRIWDIDTQKIITEVSCVQKINTFYSAKALCRMDFEPTDGKYLAYPNNREIVLLDSTTWGQRMAFTHNSIKCSISQCQFSPCGQYLAGSTVAGQIAVWEVQTGTCMGIIEHPTSHNVSAIAWNPKGNGVLAYCDVAGQLGTLVNCYGKDSSKFGADDNLDDIEMIERDNDDNDLVDDLIQADDSDDDNAISLERIKNETLGLGPQPEAEPLRRPRDRGLASPQPPFQPSATPANLEHRYLCWNDVGIVRCHTMENGESTIDVEFHDTNVHHGITLNNYLNHTMASLSTTVLALACETPSKLVCISLVGSSKEWSVSMPDTEQIVCLSAAAAVVACATDARLLRLFTVLGTQRQVISLCGPAVCLASYNTSVMVVYHRTDPGVIDQHLSMDIITVNGRQARSKTVAVALSAGARLRWLGAARAPAAADSAGVLRLCDVSSGLWLPVAHTATHSKGLSDSWFIVSVSESSQTVRAILCRGTSFPATVPKPIVVELPFQIPLCELESEKSQLEERLLRGGGERETALKLFALACRSEIEQRALELMELLKDDRLLPLAAKYASRVGRIHLADKLTNLADTWEREADKMNVAQNSHFQELDTQETYDVTNTEDMNASLIIPQKAKEKKVEITPIKPVPIKSSPGGARNPFRKQQEAAKTAQNPLSLTDRNLVEVHSTDLSENNDTLKPLEGETFVDWFSRNKKTMEQESPDLTPSELTRNAVRMFKSIQSKPSSDTSGNKRKLDDHSDPTNPPVTNAPKQSKLSAFAFQKKA